MVPTMRSQRGQTSIEYLGVIVVVALLLGVLLKAAPGIGASVSGAIGAVIADADGTADGSRADTGGGARADGPSGGSPADGGARSSGRPVDEAAGIRPGPLKARGASRRSAAEPVSGRRAKAHGGEARYARASAAPTAIVGPLCRILCRVFKRPPKAPKPPRPPRAVPKAVWQPWAVQRGKVIRELDRVSKPSTGAKAKGRDVPSSAPRDAAYLAFRRLTKGPGVKRVKKTDDFWAVDTPDGFRVTLRNPRRSSTKDWTVDLVRKGTKDERHYKFKVPK